MYKKITFLFVLFLSVFIFRVKVYAECSYDERKTLLNKTKKIEVFFEPNLEKKYFEFKLYNLDKDLYLTITNNLNEKVLTIHNYDLKKEYYSLIDENVDKESIYTINIYSNLYNCFGNKLLSKKLHKGIINEFYFKDICKGIEDYQYCKPILKKSPNISDKNIEEKIKKYKNELKNNNKQNATNDFIIKTIIIKYWYIILFCILCLIIVITLLIINHKRGELD